MSDVDLHVLFDKLDEVLSGPWNLRRVQGKIGRVWQLTTRVDDRELLTENASPELVVRAMLGLVLERVQVKANGKADEARAAREEVERMQRVIEGVRRG